MKSLEWIIEDVFKRVENVSNEKTGTGRIREVQLIPQFYFFLWKARKKAYACSMIVAKFPISFFEDARKRLLCILRDRRQETEDI